MPFCFSGIARCAGVVQLARSAAIRRRRIGSQAHRVSQNLCAPMSLCAYEPKIPLVNLLIIDDEASLRDFLSIVFEGEGWRVEAVGSLGDARVAIQRAEPDVVLCDLVLPDGSGIDLIRDVKAASPSIVFVMITAHTSTRSAVEALKA